MKSKKLLVFLIMFLFVAVLVVLNSTLFTLQHINVCWLTSTETLKNLKESQITTLIEDQKGESIFLLNKDDITEKLEKTHPYLRVVGVETKFPNKILVYTAERDDLYALKLSDGNYAIIDDYGKVLAKTQTIESKALSTMIEARPIEVNFNNIQLNVEDFVVGEMVKIGSVKKTLTDLSMTLKEANYTTLAKKGVFSGITISNMGENGQIGMYLTTRNGMVINLIDAGQMLTDKFMLGLQVYNKYQQDSYINGSIVVQYSQENDKIIAYFDD